MQKYSGSLDRMAKAPVEQTRPALLALLGVGPETADAILLYALNQPVMVVDEYLRRVVTRHSLIDERARYPDIQQLALSAFAADKPATLLQHFNEFHALIVMVGKTHCGGIPRCAECPLKPTRIRSASVPRQGSASGQAKAVKQQTLYVATGNAGKLRDFAIAAAVVNARWSIAPLPGLKNIPAPPEDGATFEENARAKALAYARHAPGEIVLADDSGLCVDALNGAPGIYSARYADRLGWLNENQLSRDQKDARNNHCLLHQLASTEARTASYTCILAASRDGQLLATAQGALEGRILTEPRGKRGFGYDPLFEIPALSLTMAEVDEQTRIKLSHRGQALRRLLPVLAALLD